MNWQEQKIRLIKRAAESKQPLRMSFYKWRIRHHYIVRRYTAFTDKAVEILTLIVINMEPYRNEAFFHCSRTKLRVENRQRASTLAELRRYEVQEICEIIICM